MSTNDTKILKSRTLENLQIINPQKNLPVINYFFSRYDTDTSSAPFSSSNSTKLSAELLATRVLYLSVISIDRQKQANCLGM